MGVVLKGCWRVDRWGEGVDRAVVVRAREKVRVRVRVRVGCIVVEVGVVFLNTEFRDVRGSSRSDSKAPIMLSIPQGR